MNISNAPIMVLNANTERETGKKAQLGNIAAAKAIADIIVTTLGPRSMMKMLLDPMGGIVLSNDGHAILREIDVNHPAAKTMLEISRAQDEEVGDGTTSVIILAGEMMVCAKPFIERNIHPSVIVSAFRMALDDAWKFLETKAIICDIKKPEEIKKSIVSCIGTKFTSRWGNLIVNLAYDAIKTLSGTSDPNKLGADLKRFAKVEKIPGGNLEDCQVLNGVMVNKDVTHPQMRRFIKKPRVILLDCPLEYKKGESQTNIEMNKESDMIDALQEEVNEVALMCSNILKYKPDVVVTEKGVSDLAQHYLVKANVSVIRRIRKTDNNRVARVSGAKIVNRPEDLQESDVGTLCGLFEIKKIGDEYFTYFIESDNPRACTILLRGASKDVLNEVERNLHDALGVSKNIFLNPKLLPGGGASEMMVSQHLLEKAKSIEGLQQLPYKAVAYAMEIIPKTLAQNCGADVVRIITELRAKHAEGGSFYGIDGNLGKIADMKEGNIWEPILVKSQVIKSAIEAASMLIRIDDIVSGIKKKKPQGPAMQPQQGNDDGETFGDNRDG